MRAAPRRQPTGVGSLTGITRYVNSSDSPRTIPGFLGEAEPDQGDPGLHRLDRLTEIRR